MLQIELLLLISWTCSGERTGDCSGRPDVIAPALQGEVGGRIGRSGETGPDKN